MGPPHPDGKVPLPVVVVHSRRPQELSRVSDGDERSELALDSSEDGGPTSLAKTFKNGPLALAKMGEIGPMSLAIDRQGNFLGSVRYDPETRLWPQTGITKTLKAS